MVLSRSISRLAATVSFSFRDKCDIRLKKVQGIDPCVSNLLTNELCLLRARQKAKTNWNVMVVIIIHFFPFEHTQESRFFRNVFQF